MPFQFDGVLGCSPAMRNAVARAAAVAETNAPVLILGESGTGKDLVAQAIHKNSSRAQKTFLTVNCGAIPENLLESELFGHRKGAFTGAVAERAGKFESAAGGTIFLDEVSEIPFHLQVKLLRVVQSGEIQRVGEDKPIRVNVRITASSNSDLAQLVKEGKFRADLYYRLAVVEIRMPALRQRREDLPLLVDYFVAQANGKYHKNILRVESSALRCLLCYHYPGNLRELEHIIDQAVVLCRGSEIKLEDLKPEVQAVTERIDATMLPETYKELRMAQKKMTDEMERRFLNRVLVLCKGNVSEAAARARMNRVQFHRLMRKHGISREEIISSHDKPL